ncbi:MAG: cysnophycinase-like exopeptidase [Acidimicrobiaceae bacterium]|nr:cysnophycinase-like exopeptidase [Acidimicrobiaceae bacterium]
MPSGPSAAGDLAADQVGPLALVGGGEWTDGATFDAELLERSLGEVLVLPTAAAYERPERAVAHAAEWFGRFGGRVQPCMVLARTDAQDRAAADQVRAASFIYLAGGSPLHLRSVLKDSAVLRALLDAWHDGAIVAGSSAGAMALSDPMVDPRGGAFTVGLGLVRNLAVVPHYLGEPTAQLRRTLALAPAGCAVVALGERTALIRDVDGTWRIEGAGASELFLDGRPDELDALAGKPLG